MFRCCIRLLLQPFFRLKKRAWARSLQEAGWVSKSTHLALALFFKFHVYCVKEFYTCTVIYRHMYTLRARSRLQRDIGGLAACVAAVLCLRGFFFAACAAAACVADSCEEHMCRLRGGGVRAACSLRGCGRWLVACAAASLARDTSLEPAWLCACVASCLRGISLRGCQIPEDR